MDKYRLQVTAGPDYDPSTHQLVAVNANQTLLIENDHAHVGLCVRIQDYAGYPENSPSTHSYFEHPLHRNDQYSIAASIVFKNSVNGDDLVFGNDFDHPIRDRLPPGFNTALRIVKWTLDPAIDGDAYADQPYLYSPALATWNQFHIGHAAQTSNGLSLHDLVVQEGAEDGPAAAIRRDNGIPDQVDARRKYFQNAERRKQFGFEPGRLYLADFGNPYLGFSDFSLRLPGFHLHVMKYVDEKNHALRYVLRNRVSGVIYFVVVFTLILRQPNGEKESKQIDRTNLTLGKFDWESEPSAADVD